MKHFTHKVRQQVICALFIAAVSAFPGATALHADELDDAIIKMKASPEAPIVDRSVIFRRQPVRNVALSPSGDRIIYHLQKGRLDEIWVHMVASGDRKKLLTSKDVSRVSWSSDGQYIFVRNRKNVSVLPLSEGALAEIVLNVNSEEEEFYFGVDEGHPHAFFVSLKDETDDNFILFRVLPDGMKQELYRSVRRIDDFLLVPHKNMLLLKRNLPGLTSEISIYADGRETVFETCAFGDPCRFIGASEKGDYIYIQARLKGDLTSLYKMNVSTRETELLHADPEATYDLNDVIFDRAAGKPLFATYQDAYSSAYGLDGETQDMVKAFISEVGEKHFELATNSQQTKWLLTGVSSTHADLKFYLYDPATKVTSQPLKEHLDEIYSREPRIAQDHIGARVAVSYRVSDGMLQHGYVTLPRGVDPATVPLVVFPHGGPWSRDYGAYKSLAAFLANRGYAVFEPAFRASSGYGMKYLLSANRDFGKGRVHQDIMDGMEYILSRGVGDRKKLAIAGHSFGGFSAVGALAFEPDVFQVGFAGAPPVDLVAAVRFLAKRAKSDRELRRLARLEYLSADPDIEGQTEELYDKSPAAYADKVIKPLYLWAGEKDDRVNILNVRKYAFRQREAGKAVSLMVEPAAGHSPRKALHREAYYYMLEKALHDHVGGRMQAEVSNRLSKYLQKSLVVDENRMIPASN